MAHGWHNRRTGRTGTRSPHPQLAALSLSLSLRVRACERACVRESSAHRRPALRSADTLRGESASRVRVTGLYVDTKGGVPADPWGHFNGSFRPNT